MRSEPGLPGMDTTPRIVRFNNLGFRGSDISIFKPPGEKRIFIVGGSTTECSLLSDAESLAGRLEAKLRASNPGVRVYAAARSGDESFDHVAVIAHRIMHLKPDLIIVFAGVNDLGAGIVARDYLLRGTATRPAGFWRLVAMTVTELQLPRLVHRAWQLAFPRGWDSETLTYRNFAPVARSLPLSKNPPRTDVEPYVENLTTIAGIAKGHGVPLVLMTQATTWNTRDTALRRWHWILGEGVRYNEASLDSAMEVYNNGMRAVAQDA